MLFCKLNRCMQADKNCRRYTEGDKKSGSFKRLFFFFFFVHVIGRKDGCSKKVLKNDNTFGG